MKKISLFSNSLMALMALAIVCLTSCGEDPINPGAVPPTVRLVDNGNGSLTTDATVNAGEVFTINIVASPGDNPLNTVTIDEDGTTIALDRLNGTTNGVNPAVLFNDDKDGIDWNVDITAPNASGDYLVTVTVADDGNESSSVSITITIADDPPTVALVNSSGSINAAPGSLVAVKVNATPGSRRLNTIAVWENGVAINDLSRIQFKGVEFTANPLTLEETDKDGFTEAEVLIRAVDAGGVTNTYTILIEDEGFSAAESESFDIVSGTPLTMTLDGILFNAGGPGGTGGINLKTGEGTGSNADEAQLHDEGIDVNLAADVNWIQRISGESNGSEVKLVDTSVLPEGFSFASVSSVEEITGAHDSGNAFTNTNDDGELVSWLVEVGDLYTVKNGDDIFLIEIREVNIKPDMGDNSDNYVIDIKY
ncbi:MAG: hypothetical protein AAF985_15545 [Bacteroidota bacterium]